MMDSVYLVTLVVVGATLLFLLALLVYLPVFSVKQFRKRRRFISVASGVVWLLLMTGVVREVYGVMPGKDVIIARVTTSDGIDLCVTHKSNYSTEPYTVSFYFKRQNQPWGWFYYDHQDSRWFSGSIELNDEGTMAYVKRGRSVVATFDMTTDSFTVKRWNRTTRGADEWMPDGWTPEQALLQ